MGDVMSGSLSRDDAVLRLEALRETQELESELQAEVEACARSLLGVELELSWAEQRRILDETPGLLDGIADHYASLVEDIASGKASGA
jgi:hypothetical protein